MFKYRSQKQLSIFDFHTDFESKLDPNNRWVKMAKMLDWDKLAEVYAQTFSTNMGAGSIDARIVIGALIINHLEKRDKRELIYWETIQELYRQQEQIYRTGTNSIEHRIVSIHQPFIRPIVRGKEGKKVEFGSKINVSLINGYTRINQFDFEAFNEGNFLQAQVEAYKKFYGFYPELVQTDDIYMSRNNRKYLKEHVITLKASSDKEKPVTIRIKLWHV